MCSSDLFPSHDIGACLTILYAVSIALWVFESSRIRFSSVWSLTFHGLFSMLSLRFVSCYGVVDFVQHRKDFLDVVKQRFDFLESQGNSPLS